VAFASSQERLSPRKSERQKHVLLSSH